MSEKKYKYFLKDFCTYLLTELEETKKPKDDFENGVNQGIWAILNHLKNEAEKFDLDQRYLGIDGFDPYSNIFTREDS